MTECEFHYRESVFKRHKEWIIFSTELRLDPADGAELRKTADDILKVRNEKFPVTMKCAGSIFKNLLLQRSAADGCRAGASGRGAGRQSAGGLVSGAGGRQGHAARAISTWRIIMPT